MKKHTLLFSFIFIFISCDIEEKPFITDYDSYVNPDKKVLIEDFTGHTCPNCPEAAREIEAIYDIYGEQIIAMAIHVTKSFARPYPASQAPKFQYDFRTQWGNEWDALYGISEIGLPRGMINRTLYPNGHKLGKDEWANAVALELKKEIDFKISITSNVSSAIISTEITNDIIGDFNIVVCLTENNIISWQKDGQLEVEDYQHNHVLRSVIAEEILSNENVLYQGDVIEKTYAINLNELEQYNIDYSLNTAELGNGNAGGWASDNLSIIVYIYNNTTKEIMQVEEAHLIN